MTTDLVPEWPDPIVFTDQHGRATLPHGLDHAPTWVLLRIGNGATAVIQETVRLFVDEFDNEKVGFRAVRADNGQPLMSHPIPVRMSAR